MCTGFPVRSPIDMCFPLSIIRIKQGDARPVSIRVQDTRKYRPEQAPAKLFYRERPMAEMKNKKEALRVESNVAVSTSTRNVCCTIINDEVTVVGTARVPTGNWYVVFTRFGNPVEFLGPYPLTYSRKGREEHLQGFVSKDLLRNLVMQKYKDMDENPCPLFLVSGENLMLSLWIEG